VVRTQRATRKHRQVGVDTNVLIYFVQNHPQYGEKSAKLFEHIEQGHMSAVTSTLALMEVLVQPYRVKNDPLVNKFYALLTTYPGLSWVPVSLEVADRGAELRARYNLSTPDAIHISTAILGKATAFVGNDKALKKIKEIEILTLAEVI